MMNNSRLQEAGFREILYLRDLGRGAVPLNPAA
jgi:hypothetical protein